MLKTVAVIGLAIACMGCGKEETYSFADDDRPKACPKGVVAGVANKIVDPAIKGLSETNADLLDSNCNSFAVGLLGEFQYTMDMVSVGNEAGCDWSVARPEEYGLRKLREHRARAEAVCPGSMESRMMKESARLRGRRVLDNLPAADREAMEREWQAQGGTLDR